MRVKIGKNTAILMGLRLYTKSGLSIGSNSVIERDCVLDARGGITIGDNVIISPEAMILTSYHDPDDAHFCSVLKPVVIEDSVWIASRVLILPGVRIAKGSVVAAGSVVTKDIPQGTIVGGNPARKIRDRLSIQIRKVNDHFPLFS